MLFHSDVFKFLFGFLGMVFFGLSFLVAVGFYRTEISGNKSISRLGPAVNKIAGLPN